MIEPVPIFNAAPCEHIIKNKNNSWIVLGRDRPAGLDSGKGGDGEERCGSIDMVVGRMGWDPSSEAIVDNNFIDDAARLYISQRTNIDANFGLPAGKVGISTNSSAIGLRADDIRIMSRKGIKLVTGVYGKLNTDGQTLDTIMGIDLIAGGQDKPIKHPELLSLRMVERLQPLVKGDNLVQCIRETNERIRDLIMALEQYFKFQMQINASIASHLHPALVVYTFPDPTLGAVAIANMFKQMSFVIGDLPNHKKALATLEERYLTPSVQGVAMNPEYICSSYNTTN
jgi:hypothetical protein